MGQAARRGTFEERKANAIKKGGSVMGGVGNNGGKPVKLHVDLNQCQDIPCVCGCLYFRKLTRIKKMSAVMSPDGRDQNLYLDVLICNDCGRIAGTDEFYKPRACEETGNVKQFPSQKKNPEPGDEPQREQIKTEPVAVESEDK